MVEKLLKNVIYIHMSGIGNYLFPLRTHSEWFEFVLVARSMTFDLVTYDCNLWNHIVAPMNGISLLGIIHVTYQWMKVSDRLLSLLSIPISISILEIHAQTSLAIVRRISNLCSAHRTPWLQRCITEKKWHHVICVLTHLHKDVT